MTDKLTSESLPLMRFERIESRIKAIIARNHRLELMHLCPECQTRRVLITGKDGI